MTINDKIRSEKLQYDINKQRSLKISALSSGKTDKHEYLMGKKTLISDQSRIIEQQNILLSVKHLKNKQKQLKNK